MGKETNSPMHGITRQVAFLIVLIAALGLLYYLSLPRPQKVEQDTKVSLAEQIRRGEVPIPEYSTSTQAKLEKSGSFVAVVSYTDDGFEPNRVKIKRGERVRFTNNSSSELWIASEGGSVQIYPHTKDVCGSSDLDSCAPFDSQDFWEFTFDISGEWHVINNLDKSKGGIVMVE